MEPDPNDPSRWVHFAQKGSRYPCGVLKGITWYARTTDPALVTCPPCGGSGPPLPPKPATPGRLPINGSVIGRAGMARRQRIAARDGGPFCAYCGVEHRLDEMVLEHVVPKSQGGVDEDENRVLACERCDNEKKGQTPQQWKPGVVWPNAIANSPSKARKPRRGTVHLQKETEESDG